MADVPRRRLFTKAVRAEPAEPANVASSQGPLKRLKKCQAKTSEGVMRFAGKIIENGQSQPRPEIRSPMGPKYSEQRCVTIDPNAYCAPSNRVRSPREERNRRPEGWTARWFVLPRAIVEGLQALTIELACQQQNSDWPAERCRYPRTKNFHVTAALNDYFAKLGYQQYCVSEPGPAGGRVRRFTPTT